MKSKNSLAHKAQIISFFPGLSDPALPYHSLEIGACRVSIPLYALLPGSGR